MAVTRGTPITLTDEELSLCEKDDREKAGEATTKELKWLYEARADAIAELRKLRQTPPARTRESLEQAVREALTDEVLEEARAEATGMGCDCGFPSGFDGPVEAWQRFRVSLVKALFPKLAPVVAATAGRDFVFSCPSCGHPSAQTVEVDVDIHAGATYRCDRCQAEVIFTAQTPAQYVKLAAPAGQTDDSDPMDHDVLAVAERVNNLAERLTRGPEYPNRNFEVGVIHGALAALESLLDPNWPELKAAYDRRAQSRLAWAVKSANVGSSNGKAET